MDIKLRARLSAYSRVDQITNTPSAPDNDSGCDRVTEREIDTLFEKKSIPSSKPTGGSSVDVVSYSEIDSLFN